MIVIVLVIVRESIVSKTEHEQEHEPDYKAGEQTTR
jgi:hypothetical protein